MAELARYINPMTRHVLYTIGSTKTRASQADLVNIAHTMVDVEPMEAARAIIARGLPEARGWPDEGRQEAAADDDGADDFGATHQILNANASDIVFLNRLF